MVDDAGVWWFLEDYRFSRPGRATEGALVSAREPWAADTDQTRELRAQMVAALVQEGDVRDERWGQVFGTVPRHALVPRYYRPDNYQEIDGTTEHHRSMWLRGSASVVPGRAWKASPCPWWSRSANSAVS